MTRRYFARKVVAEIRLSIEDSVPEVNALLLLHELLLLLLLLLSHLRPGNHAHCRSNALHHARVIGYLLRLLAH